ncbi:methylated-DNA--[protein]-cysteine S-methyltransferase [Salegentibacter sp. HM20]
MNTKISTAQLKTPLGIAKISGNEQGISEIKILDEAEDTSAAVPDFLQNAIDQLQEYFAGERKHFELKLNAKGSEFQQKVWQELLKVPFGKTCSYLELAKRVGDVNAIRAVAAANGKNPLWVVVPCHRVIGSNGELTGYAGGLHRKKWLLNHESPHPQQDLFS